MNDSAYFPTIGLEVHAQLTTDSKLFSPAANNFGGEPNAQTTPVCLGMPGTLPVLNRRALTLAVRAGLALGCRIREKSIFARKHYTYPDLPKGYQITQFEEPICEGGEIPLPGGDPVPLRRIHIEEDAGRSNHELEAELTLVDLNRAGAPLLEIVSEPAIHSSADALSCLKSLRDILVALGVNDGNLEEGTFRCDANVSVSLRDSKVLGTRCELKNLNSFRFLKEAIDFEVSRQVDILQSGGTIVQETRLFDSKKKVTRGMRGKEESKDYRYFPDPDLPPVLVSPALIEAERAKMPELPAARLARYLAEFALQEPEARAIIADPPTCAYFDACVAAGASPKRTAHLLLGDIARFLEAQKGTFTSPPFTAAQVADLASVLDEGLIPTSAVRSLLPLIASKDVMPRAAISSTVLADRAGQSEVIETIEAILAAEPNNVAAYRRGQTKVLGYFVGLAMKSLRGKANPRELSELLTERLNKPS